MGCCQPNRRRDAATWGTAASLRRGLLGVCAAGSERGAIQALERAHRYVAMDPPREGP